MSSSFQSHQDYYIFKIIIIIVAEIKSNSGSQWVCPFLDWWVFTIVKSLVVPSRFIFQTLLAQCGRGQQSEEVLCEHSSCHLSLVMQAGFPQQVRSPSSCVLHCLPGNMMCVSALLTPTDTLFMFGFQEKIDSHMNEGWIMKWMIDFTALIYAYIEKLHWSKLELRHFSHVV